MQKTMYSAIKLKPIIISYKGKVLLISREEESNFLAEPIWSFLNKQNVRDLLLKKVEVTNPDSNFDLIILKDEQVNYLIRKEGWRLEFYKLEELSKLKLSEDAKLTLLNHSDKIKVLLL